MRRVFSAVAAFVFASLCVGADFQAGKLAYDRGDYAAALKQWIPAAESGDRQAQKYLGDLYRDGKGTPADKAQALGWYRLASAQGDIKASFEVVDLCGRGTAEDNLADACRGVTDTEDSVYGRIYGGIRTLAEKHDAEAEFILATILTHRVSLAFRYSKVPYAKELMASPEWREADKWRREAVKQGYVPAGLVMAAECRLMWSEKDQAQADAWGLDNKECADILNLLTKNIDDLSPYGQLQVGWSYLHRPDPDLALAIAFIEKAARRNLTFAQEELGRLFYEGSEVLKDYAKAAQWYRKYVESAKITLESFYGIRQASERLGYLYSAGLGVPTNDQQATRWFLRAAEMGSAYAQRSLAYRYKDGQGVLKDLGLAATWFRRAAEQGDVESQYMFGIALYIGMGVPEDYVHAHMWFNLAAASGNTEAAVGRDGVAKYMSPEQIGEAQALAANWHPRPDPADIYAPREVQRP
jgi:TPR repeat protein